MYTKSATRSWIIGIVALGHAGLIALLSFAMNQSHERPRPVPEPSLHLAFLDEAVSTDTQHVEIDHFKPLVRAITLPEFDAPVLNASESAKLSRAPLALPPIDWEAESARIARELAARQFDELPAAFSQRPERIQAPPMPSAKQFGEDVRLDGGEIAFAVDDRCYYTDGPPSAALPDPVALQVPTCKRFKGNSAEQLEASLRQMH